MLQFYEAGSDPRLLRGVGSSGAAPVLSTDFALVASLVRLSSPELEAPHELATHHKMGKPLAGRPKMEWDEHRQRQDSFAERLAIRGGL